MNAIGATFVWAAVQITLFTAVGSLAYLIARRRGPAWGSLAAASALGAVLIVSLLAISPWPRWWNVGARDGVNRAVVVAPSTNGALDNSTNSAESAESAATIARLQRELAESRRIMAMWDGLMDSLRTDEPAAGTWRWPAWLAIGILAVVAFSAARIGVGLIAVSRYRRRSIRVDDPDLNDLVATIRNQLNCAKNMEARESSEIVSPATIGWRRPVILLPIEWREWTAEEVRVVVAHEVAHIARGDFATGIVAQLGLALHYYHPLVHWLSARLRVEQELAADSLGARAAGGRALYLETLARMALRADNSAQLTWAARPFFPGPGAFMRRIDMLRQTRELNDRSPTRKVTAALIGGAALFGLLVAGLRGPEGRAADEPGKAKKKLEVTAAEVNTFLARGIDPGNVKQVEAEKDDTQRAILKREFQRRKSLNNVKQIMLAMHVYADAKGNPIAFPAASILGPDGKTPHSWRVAILPYLEQKALYDEYKLSEPWDSENNLKVLAKMPSVYQSPMVEENPKHFANYFVFTGAKAPFIAEPRKAGPQFKDIRDGTSNTIALIESRQEIPWTKPVDISYEAGKLPAFNGLYGDNFVSGFCDGSARFFSSKGDKGTLEYLIQPDDGQRIGYEKL